jgi:glucose/arabinose dehydrogenase
MRVADGTRQAERAQVLGLLRTRCGACATACATLLVLSMTLVACSRAGTPQVVPPTTSQTTAPTITPTPTPSPSVAVSDIALTLRRRWTNLSQPLFLTYAPSDGSRLFIVEKTGRIRVVKNGRLLAAAYLDLSTKVSSGGEQGLLGLAFSPDFSASGRLYVDYTDRSGNTNVVRYTVTDPASDAPRISATQRVLLVDQPYSNHNGGCIAFGPDRYLYIGLGDGGSEGDPQKRGQDPATLLAKVLRIDVGETGSGSSIPATYRVPADNPFVGRSGYRSETWAWGLRNPWRFSFDRQTGELWIGDVGQNAWEEIDLLPKGRGGQDLGWSLLEGTHPYPPSSPEPPDLSRFTMPIVEYSHQLGDAVTGGYVYRGSKNPVLVGVYLYGDYGSGRIWGLRHAAQTTDAQLADTQLNISSFGEDAAGELYVCDLGGSVWEISAARK